MVVFQQKAPAIGCDAEAKSHDFVGMFCMVLG